MTPEELVNAAEKTGLSAIALTDHDSVEGVDLLMAACQKNSLRGIPGVEISTDIQKGSMHILGYFINHHHPELENHLANIVAGRVTRNIKMIKRLNSMGLFITIDEVKSFAGGGNVGRLHFAQALITRGYVKTRREAFERFLANGRPGYANRVRLSPEEGISMINEAKGLAVLAHPFTLGLGKAGLKKVVGTLADAGLKGIEVYYPNHKPKQISEYLALAEHYNLEVTGGTDFHGSAMPETHIGIGYGSLNVPDAVLEKLDALRKQ